MRLRGILSSISIKLICNMATFRENVLTLIYLDCIKFKLCVRFMFVFKMNTLIFQN